MTASIYDHLPYLYAEQLKGKRVTLTIKTVAGGAEFFNDGRKTEGFDVLFEETEKKLGITGSTVIRQLFVATGTDDPANMKGKKITLYAIKSKKSPVGQALRIVVPAE